MKKRFLFQTLGFCLPTASLLEPWLGGKGRRKRLINKGPLLSSSMAKIQTVDAFCLRTSFSMFLSSKGMNSRFISPPSWWLPQASPPMWHLLWKWKMIKTEIRYKSIQKFCIIGMFSSNSPTNKQKPNMIRRIQDNMNNSASPGLVTEDCLSPKDFSLFRGRSWWGEEVLKFWMAFYHFWKPVPVR